MMMMMVIKMLTIFQYYKDQPQVVDCGKEGLHSTALPLTLSQPINNNNNNNNNNNSSISINSNGKKENSDKVNFLERNMEKEVDKDKDKDKGDMKTSWSLSLSPWRVMFTSPQMFKRRFHQSPFSKAFHFNHDLLRIPRAFLKPRLLLWASTFSLLKKSTLGRTSRSSSTPTSLTLPSLPH